MAVAIDEILEKTDEFLNGITDAHERRLTRVLREIERKVLALLTGIKVNPKTGKILGPKWTLKQAQKIHAQIGGILDEEFGSTVKSFIKDYDRVTAFIGQNLKTLDVPAAFSTADKEIISLLKKQDFKFYKTLEDSTVEQCAQRMYNGILSGQSYVDMTRNVAASIVTYKDVRGRSLAVHAGTYAQDALMGFYQTVHNKKAEDAGLDHWLYYGNVIRDSRSFCVARAGKSFDKETIDGWNDLDWQGKKPGDVWINRGGYRCRHHMTAVKPEWVPKGEIEVQKWKNE